MFKSNGRVTLDFDPVNDPSLTHQSFAAECDIHNIMKRFSREGVMSHITNRQELFGDFHDAVDYRTALDLVREADEQFMALPSEIRARFENDPSQFLSFVDDPRNCHALVEMGLATIVDNKSTNITKTDSVESATLGTT